MSKRLGCFISVIEFHVLAEDPTRVLEVRIAQAQFTNTVSRSRSIKAKGKYQKNLIAIGQ